ncbi:MAG: coproporphyrinogen III oxidase, partial [Candidatus Omnitrophica bacterium]|nr:coproporphyrinogen III oxidase [Candidatus Omnitrophota bacterium]
QKNGLAIERGKKLNTDDSIRQWVINSLMCRFQIDKDMFFDKFKIKFDEYFKLENEHVRICIKDGLIIEEGPFIKVTQTGQIFIRNVCMGFDNYLRGENGQKRFSNAV